MGYGMAHILRATKFIATVLTMFAAAHAGAALTAPSKAVLETARRLTIEGDDSKAKAELAKVPRAQLVSALREGLNEGGDWSTYALNAAVALDVRELAPDLATRLETSDDYKLFFAVERLAPVDARKNLTAVFLKKLDASSASVKVSILTTLAKWKEPLSAERFAKLLGDDSFQVRIALARHFAIARTELPASEQMARFEKIFAAQPYQVRLDGVMTFEALPSADQAKLKAVIGPKFRSACEKETKTPVREECSKLLKRVAKGGV